jgi:hypothetical protein
VTGNYYVLDDLKLIIQWVWFVDIFTALIVRIGIFWATAPCCLVGRYQRIGGTCCFHLSTLKMEAGWLSPTGLRSGTAQKTAFRIVEISWFFYTNVIFSLK